MKLRLLFNILFSFFTSSAVFAQAPVNDDPCNATPLTAGTGCNYVTGTTLNATATAGVSAPGCANYVGGDVWFSVTVPASGSLIFDSNTGVVTDGGMAIYNGTCSNLTLISCNDDGSANGLMPSISANGLTPGSTIYIRFWEYGNDNNGDFSICVEQVTPCATVSTNSSCASADPFCTGTSYDYCNTVNVSSLGGGGVYGCCLSTPNPAFYFMNIQSTGPITFNISQNTNAGVGIDVDFVLWGPFASQAAMCAGLAAGNIVDCSYSTAAVETATILNANAGEWYMMLITNFSNQPGNIQFSQTNSNTAGSGATNCNILTAVPGPCTSGYFTLTGTVDVPGPPSTGILTITNSSGGTQVFNAPFSSSIAYSIPNICGDGNAHSVTAVFSAAGAPIVLPANYTAPSCNTLTATPGPCVSGQYTLSGTLTTNSCMPTTGTLTISSSCGGSVVYNAPFTSPLNWSLPASNGNGGNCTITAVYSSVGAPTITSVTISEPQCCGANAGTVNITANNGTVSTSGTNTQVTLCYGGSVSLVSNNDYVLPPSYDPGFDDSELFYAIYLPPGPTVPDPDLDPNWTGYYWTGQDFANSAYSTNSSNCGSPILNLPGINATNNTLVFVPITADDGDNGLDWDNVVAHDQNGDGCFDIGNPISITFLNPITCTSTATCSGSVSIQINGGYPEFLSGLYTISNTGAGALSATSATSGGSVSISGLTTGQTYSINVTDAGGCAVATYSGVYQGPPTISLTATPSTICFGSCSTLSATVNSGVVPGNATITSKECAIIADGGIGTTNGTPTVNSGNWAHTCINVSGVCDQTWNTGDVLSVKINLIHAFDADLDIYLQAPNGVYYLLSQDLGGAGANYTNTVFSATGATVISGGAGAAPFTGTFKPMGTGNNFSSLNGTSINGSWCLWVGDDGAIDQGSIQDWSLTFANQTTVTYAWTPSTGLSATNIINPIACPTTSTSYTLTVTNACGCTATATVPITVTPPISPTFNPIGPICSGAVAPALPTTSTNGITGTWSPTTINNTTSGSYTFSPSAGQCADTITISVVIDNAPTLSSIITKPLCLGNTNGAIDLTVNGGTAPFTYQWSNGSTNQDLSGLAVGTYTVTASSANGCTAVLSNVVAAPLAVVASIASTTNIDCFGQSTGGITANGSGGTSPYTYLWSTGATTNVISNLPAGVYTITVTDANGCTNNTNVIATLLQQPQLTVSLPIVANVSCFGGNNGSITASPTGGTAGYNYSWSNGATGPTTSGLTIGSYTVTVTDSRGCTNTASTTITQPPQLAISIPSSTNVLCNGGATGIATALATSGTPVYTYLWSNGGSTATVNNLTAGTYVVTATDANGCTISTSATITQPTLLTATIPTTANVLCNGGSTGSATVSAIGGTAGYTYLWNTGSTISSISNLTAGTYTVTATDANGCTSFTTTTITQPSALVVTIPITSNVLCNGGLTGSVTASASSGTPNYTYAWSTGATTTTISNLQVGTYTVTATDANGCTNTTSTTLTQPTALVLTPSSSTSTCGQANGSAGVSVSGGVSSYSYLWSSGQTTASINNVASGGYVVTVIDANGCTSSTTANVGSIGGPTVTLTNSSNVSCFGGTNGSAHVNASAGTGPFLYSWLPSGGSGANASNLPAGSYTVNVTDGNGCTSSVSVVISQPTQLTLSIPTTSNVLCNGGSTGSATALASNGTIGYTYLWNNGTTSATNNNLTAGTYTVTATDGNGCTVSTTAVITQPSLLTLSIPSTTNVLCNGNATGSATALATNGTAVYLYQWNIGATTATINNLTVGSYTVTATDENGCTTSTTATITQPTLLTISIPSTTNVFCNGGATGSATALASNGTAGYTYQWNTGATTATINNLIAGTYTVTATDANGCTTSTTATITQPSLLTLSIPSTINVLCNGGSTGSATALASSGTAGYTYQWNTGATTATINNLTAGTYTVTATDANGCAISTTATITQPTLLTISIPSKTNVLCNGGATGSATVLASNGTAGYVYQWNTGATTSTINNLTVGVYAVTATDANGCTLSTIVSITQPSAIVLSTSSNPTFCGQTNGSANVSAVGGVPGYAYNWSSGQTTAAITNIVSGGYVVTVTDFNGCTMSTSVNVGSIGGPTVSIANSADVSCFGGTNGSAQVNVSAGTGPFIYNWVPVGGNGVGANNLSAGSYSVNVTDANGCTSSVSLVIAQPTQVAVTIQSTTNVLCNGGATGSATSLASNGTSGYTYQWNTGATTATINNLTAGTYTVTATDANGCTTSTTASITQPTLLTISIPSTTNVLCNGGATGTATALAANGTSGYSYHWNTGATTATINNLTAGTYTVTATDANGCTASTIASITQPTLLTLSIPSTTNVLCNGNATGSATALASNGTSGYIYQWNTGATTATINNLTAGTYTVTVTDANGCTTSTSTTITQPTLLTLSIPSTTNVLCNGGNTGSASALASNGTAGYTYQWNTGATSATINNLAAGVYTVTATDANGCTTSTTATITQPTPLTLSIPSKTNVLCNGESTGSATALATNGTSGYTYQWNTGATSATINNLTAGTYTTTATDANGCTTSTSTIITQPSALVLSIPASTNVLCNGGSTGSATTLASNGTAGYSYLWSNGSTTVSINNLTAGTYTVTATDANGCTTSTSATISQPTVLTLAIPTTTNVLCNGGNTGSTTALASNGTAGYSYLWSNGSTTAINNNLTAGTYTVTATDANGCTTSTSTTITQQTLLTLSIPATTNVLCNGGNTGSATALASNGTAGYSYLWNNGSTTTTINNLTAGTYTVTATDASGCTTSKTAIISQPSALTIAIPSTTNVLCNGGATGSATALASNGSAGYTYLWNSGVTTAIANNLSAGNYTVTVTDANGCTTTATTVIIQPSAIILTGNSTSTLCGQLNGNASVSATGGTGAYSYLWSNGSTGSSINNVASGGYVVTVTDANGCSTNSAINVGSIGGPTVSIANSTDVTCFGGTNGSAQVNVSAGTGPYTYAWLPTGGSASTANNLTAGNYSVNVTDANGCTSSVSVVITQPAQVAVTIPSTTNVLCNGGSTGSATALATNGTSGYSYLWSNGSTTVTINNLSAGTYTVTATDGNGCSASSSAIITQPSLLTVAIPSATNVLCNGAASGSATALASNGTSGYSYLWSNGGNTAVVNNLTAGVYVVTATDVNGCTASASATITQPSIINIQTNSAASTCGLLNGSAGVNVSGGTSGYAYQWSNGQTSSTINNLATGFYTATVTDAKACTASVIINVGNIGGPSVAIASYSNVGCFGDATGTAQVNVSSGTAPYTYNWLPTGGSASSTSNLTAGNYSVVVTDANGCTTSTSLIITEPSELGIQTSTISSSCGQLNGGASVIVSGGVAGYNYQWSNGQTTSAINNVAAGGYTVTVIDGNGCTSTTAVNIGTIGGPTVAIANSANVTCFGGSNGSAQVNVSAGVAPFTYAWTPSGGSNLAATNLTAGNYTVSVTDANGCSNSVSINITEPASINLSTSSVSSSCGQLNGSATVNANGGSGVLSYLWNGGQTTNSVNNIASGSYSVTVTDANGCTSATTLNVGSIGGPTVTISNSTNVSCFGGTSGSAQVIVSAGVGPFTYAWLPTGGSSATAGNLTAGNYSVNVTDAHGCTSTTSVVITQPTQVTVSIQSSNNVLCNGGATGSATALAANGTSGYTYQWSTGANTATINNLTAGSYTVTATDANGCTTNTIATITQPNQLTIAIPSTTNVLCNGNATGSATAIAANGTSGYTYQWNNGATSSTINNLSAGTYTVTTTDQNGCTASASTIITEPTILNIQTSSTAATCGQLNGGAGVVVTGGVGSYTYLWSNGQSGNSINAVASGSYSITVTDFNGCTSNVFINIGSIGGPTVTVASYSDASCFGSANGSAQVNVSSGTGPFIYTWVPSGGNNASASNLTAGNYSVNVTDVNGCTSSTSVVISEPAVLTIAGSSTSSSCGQLNGTASAIVNGGVAGYSYLWSGGQTTSSISNVLSGIYSVTVTDANGCTANSSINVGSIGGPTVAISNSSNVNCFGGTNGTAQVNVSAGVGPYNYLWSPSGGNNASASNLTAGNYSVSVTDANGCTSSVSVVIAQPSQVSVTIPSTTNVLCNGAATGSATAFASNGTSGYTYQWNTGATSATINNLTAGIYTVTATDANGCTISTTASIIQPAPLVVSIPSTTNVLCNGGATGTVTALASNGTSGYLYQWNTGATGATINNLTAWTYTVTVTDANGCTISTNAIISQPTQLTVSIPSTTNVLCHGNATGSATALASNGTSGYTYQWNTGATTATINNLTAGTYTVTATDANGCTTSTTAFISQPTQLTVSILSTTNVLCNGGASGSATASASNGTSGYNYLWSNGATSSIVSGLIAGTYTVTAIDANGCTTTTTASISQPTLLTVSIPSTTNVLCNGNAIGSATALATNGTAGYIYQWNNGASTATINNLTAGIYTVTATDANGCTSTINASITQPSALTLSIPSTINILCYGGANGSATALASNGTAGYNYLWSNGSTSSTNNNLTAGVYTVTATDANGCSTFTSTTITQPNQLIAAIPNTTNVLCYGGATGTATATASSGTANYSYLWSNGTTTALNSNLTSGNYTVTITDANGCTATATTLINQPTVLSLSNFNSQDVSCNGLSDGVASLSATGGTIPYVYSWNPSVSSSGFAGSLTVGNYSVVVTDANGCSSNHAFTITQPSAIVSNATITDASCHGSTNGSIAMNVNGGISPYSYNWSNGSTLSSSTGLATGNYTLTVTDVNGCTNVNTWSVNEPSDISAAITHSDVSCYGLSDGAIQVNVNGGTPSYQISWIPSNNGFNLTNLQAGTYNAIITDANGCTHALSKSLVQPSQIVVNASTPTILCIGQSQTLFLLVSGGSPGYTYLWSNQQTTPSINVSPAVTTNYSVVVTDVNGCTSSLNNLLVNVHPPLQLNIAANNDTICLGQSVSLSANASGGNGGPYTYNWNNGINTTSQMITPSTTGAYSVSVIDGCTTPNAQQSLTIVVNPIPTPAFTPGNIQGCSPVSATFNLSSASGSGNTYLWSFGDNTTSTSVNPTHQYSGAGSYNVTLAVTNQYGCTGSVTNNNVVNVFALPIAKFTPDPSETQLLTANINFNNYSVGAAYYNWNFGDNATSTDFSPSHIYGDTGLYEVRLIASSLQQCRDTAYEYVHIVGSFTFWCPSAFSPNDDLKNDGFTGYGVGIKSASFVIFNRWGEKIYTSDNLANPWDGTFWNNGNGCPEDVYVYLFDVVSEDNEHHKYTGRVSLIK